VVFVACPRSARLGSKKAGRQSAQVDVMHKSYLVLGFWSQVPLPVLEARPMGRWPPARRSPSPIALARAAPPAFRREPTVVKKTIMESKRRITMRTVTVRPSAS